MIDRLVFPSVMTLTSPLVHSDERLETVQRFRREPFLLGDEILEIPVYSGNAIRGMLRRAAALRTCELIGVPPGSRALPTAAYYLLFSGGYLEGAAAHSWDIEEARQLRTLLPSMSLLGCSFRQRVHPGAIDVWRGEPVCRELASLPGHQGHPVYAESDPPSVFDLLCEVSFTRRDDRASELDDATSPVQMRYAYEALIPGTRLLHGCVLRATSPLLLGALADMVQTCTSWDALGGRSATGHGRFNWTWQSTIGAAYADLADEYRAHITANAEQIREMLGVRGELADA